MYPSFNIPQFGPMPMPRKSNVVLIIVVIVVLFLVYRMAAKSGLFNADNDANKFAEFDNSQFVGANVTKSEANQKAQRLYDAFHPGWINPFNNTNEAIIFEIIESVNDPGLRLVYSQFGVRNMKEWNLLASFTSAAKGDLLWFLEKELTKAEYEQIKPRLISAGLL